MKKVVIAAGLAGLAVFTAGQAQADVSLFNVNQQNIDASLNMRQSTTEQFDPVRGQSVAERPRPDFDPVPIPLGGFQLFPALNLGSYYDSNIFANQQNGTDDWVWKVNPTITAASNWGRNAVAITGLGDFNYYTQNNEQDYHAGALQAEGRYDIAEQTWLAGTAGYQRVAEIRGGLNTPGNSIGPSEYSLYSANAEAYRGVGKLKAQADYNYGDYVYDTLDLIGGGSASQDTRDRMQNKVSSQVGYEITQNLQPYISAAYDWISYDHTGINSSNGYTVDVGSKMDFGGIVTADAYLGYKAQNYVNYTNGVVSTPDYGADVLWNVTELTSLEAKTYRSIEETSLAGTSSILSTQSSFIITHELRRDIILEASAVYYSIDFQQTDEHDNIYDAGIGGRYYFDRHVYSDLTYDFERRDSTVAGNDYDRHVGFLRVGLQY